jgi:large subunit ribosomal protein L33
MVPPAHRAVGVFTHQIYDRKRVGEENNMAKKKGDRIVVKLRSLETGHVYWTEKNRRNDQGRLELKKFDPVIRKHAVYREQR